MNNPSSWTFEAKQRRWHYFDKIQNSLYVLFHQAESDPEKFRYDSARMTWLFCLWFFREDLMSMIVANNDHLIACGTELSDIADVFQEGWMV
jgi:hypothetical protein